MTSSSQSGKATAEQLDGRLSHVETQATRIDSELGALAHAFSQHVVDNKAFQGEVRTFIQNSNRFDPKLFVSILGVAGSCLGVALVIGGLVLAPTQRRLDRVEIGVEEHQQWLLNTASSRWTDIEQDRFQLRLDERLRRMESTLEGKMESLAERFNGHVMDGHPEQVLERVSAVQREVDRLRDEP